MNSLSNLDQTRSTTNRVPQVLVVDDHHDSIALLTYILDALGCCYQTANSANAALSLAHSHQFDLALLDIILPKMNGIDLLHQLKQDKKQQNMIAIAVTALAFSHDQLRIKQAGFHDYICKPYLLPDMENIICHHLRNKFPSLSKQARS